MSTNEKTLNNIVQITAGPKTGLAEVKKFFKSKTALSSLASDSKAIGRTAAEFSVWAALDRADKLMMKDFGEICYHFLQLSLEEQQPIVEALATEMGVPAPSYEKKASGGPMTGRVQLAHVVYGRFEDLTKVPKGKKDSPAGKRVSEAIRQYKISAGLMVVKRSRKRKVPTRALRIAYGSLVAVARNASERELISDLMERAGVPGMTIAKWQEERKAAA